VRYAGEPAPVVRGEDQPRLGLASTRELLDELQARMDTWPHGLWAFRDVVNGATEALKDSGVAEAELAYRTVDS
jgi:hypothetical protein